ncbi:universal stress protein UspA (plasmid) [Rhodococcus sp. WB1]|uniref:universal stress protein n=2 Tax=Rhodococcus TaxID=1827 RepID=UPI00069046E7|nr:MULTISPECIES: universal stress protein [Rhodococcus]ANZ28639.1 universal stress protein UspA [Rhodococcus sp. WB1]
MEEATGPTQASGSGNALQARVVVGVDGSGPSIEALRWAARLAHSLGATIEATIAWHPAHTYGFYPYPADYRPDQEAAGILSDAITAAFESAPPPRLVESVREGHPSQVLIDAARHAQMLVVGSRGHGGFTGLLLGSVSAYCAEHAPCPVLVVRPQNPTAEH